MTFIDHLIKFAENELKLIGFDQAPVGQTMLEFLKNSAELSNNDSVTMAEMSNMLTKLINRQPISPITEADFKLEYPDQEHSQLNLMRCTRYPHVYQSADGKYWDDRAVAFRFANSPETDRMFVYRPNGSKREITLPYYPDTKVEYLNQDSV
jgi:hypothetical protein